MRDKEIAVIYGNEPAKLVPRILHHLDIISELPQKGTIAIKPNLVVAKKSETGATTDPRIVDTLLGYLKENGFHDLVIMESAWVGDSTTRAFATCGYRDIAEKHGVPLVDLKPDTTRHCKAGGLDLEVCETALNVAYLINIPVLKAHCQTRLTCALKNLKGCIPDREKRRFHALGLHEPIAALSRILRSDLILVDGIVGDLTFEEGGTPVEMNRIFAGRDPVLIDAYAATLLGYSPSEIAYIGIAESLGVGDSDVSSATITSLNKGSESQCAKANKKVVSRLLEWLDQDMACSACVGSAVHALMRLGESRGLERIQERVKVGQGYQGKCAPGIGIGTCTSGLTHHVGGCPPNSRRIVEFLSRLFPEKRR